MRELEKKAKEEAAEGGTPHTVASPQSSLGHHNNSVNHNNSSHTPHTGEQDKSINLIWEREVVYFNMDGS